MNPGLLPPRILPVGHERRPLALAPSSYVTPAHIDRRPELLPCSNQGNAPRCAAYAMAGWLEYYRWKHFGIAEQIDPNPIYKRAKEIDGAPNEEGTYLECVLDAAADLNLIDRNALQDVRQVSSVFDVRQALHRYGVVLCAFNVTDKWMHAQPEGWIPEGGNSIGGHAVLCCGYSDVETPNWYAIQNSWGELQGWRGFNRMTPQQFESQLQYGLVWEVKQ